MSYEKPHEKPESPPSSEDDVGIFLNTTFPDGVPNIEFPDDVPYFATPTLPDSVPNIAAPNDVDQPASFPFLPITPTPAATLNAITIAPYMHHNWYPENLFAKISGMPTLAFPDNSVVQFGEVYLPGDLTSDSKAMYVTIPSAIQASSVARQAVYASQEQANDIVVPVTILDSSNNQISTITYFTYRRNQRLTQKPSGIESESDRETKPRDYRESPFGEPKKWNFIPVYPGGAGSGTVLAESKTTQEIDTKEELLKVLQDKVMELHKRLEESMERMEERNRSEEKELERKFGKMKLWMANIENFLKEVSGKEKDSNEKENTIF